VNRAEFIDRYIYIGRKPYDISQRPWLVPAYNTDTSSILFKTARQVEKSTFCSCYLITEMVDHPGNKALYASPTGPQTTRFSSSIFKPLCIESPFINGVYFHSNSTKNEDRATKKSFVNGSYTEFISCFYHADRARGASGRMVVIDEIQDMLPENIPIIEETTSHFMDDRIIIKCGTPKNIENIIEREWRDSNQCEWMVPCHRCEKLNVPLGEKNIGKRGPICMYCGTIIDPMIGMWVAMNPGSTQLGFHISQLMVPWVAKSDNAWKSLIKKYERMPRHQFFNEVLGISKEQANAALSEEDLIKACLPGVAMYGAFPQDKYYPELVSGVDWGMGLGSYTVHVIGGVYSGRFEVVYMKRYDPGQMDQMEIVKSIGLTNYLFKVRASGCDWGAGYMPNQELQKVNPTIPVFEFYSSSSQKAKIARNERGGFYTINRNSTLSDVITEIKKGNLKFFRWQEFQDFKSDFLAIFPDYHSRTRMLYYNHPADVPDDAVHATSYAYITSRILGRETAG
jgi:hypothetical protein